MHCGNNLKQIGLALHNYHAAKKTLPYGANYPSAKGGTWTAFILPQLEQQNIYDRFNFSVKLSDAVNSAVVKEVIATYICPSDGDAAGALLGGRVQAGGNNAAQSMALWYPASMGPTRDGVAAANSCIYCGAVPQVGSYCCADTDDFGCCNGSGKPGVGLFDRASHAVNFKLVTDGLSKTIMAGESIPSQCSFHGAYHHNFPIAGTTIPINTFEDNSASPGGKWFSACGFKSRHAGGAMFLIADGSVRFFSDVIDYRLFNELGTRAGDETVALP
jgi:hypothetical protein